MAHFNSRAEIVLPKMDEGRRQGIDVTYDLYCYLAGSTILGMIAHNEDVPAPSPANGRPVVRLPALTAAKLELYRAMRQAGLDETQLAQRLGWPSKKITHIFDGYHVVRLEQLETALSALGRRFVVSSEPA